MSDIIEDFEDFWYDVDRRWEQTDSFLSEVGSSLDCPCPVCNISEDEKNWATKQVDKWIQRWG